jgi:hypothetical protein
MNSLSICIPRVFINIPKNKIKSVFQNLKIGNIERIDTIYNNSKSSRFYRVFIHFNTLYNTKNSIKIFNILNNNDDATFKVIYDNPWFWKCSKSRIPKPK